MIRPLATSSADPSFGHVHRLGFSSYVADVREAIVNAKERVVVVTPFIDNAGVEFLSEVWRDRAHDSTPWSIYVRDCPPRLRNLARAKEWNVYEYPGGEKYGMHAKVILIDDNRAILGSMNFLHKSMYSNLELGVDITDDPMIGKLTRLEYMLKRASRLVSK